MDTQYLVLKKTKWVTNSICLAEGVDRWCSNGYGGPPHVHVQLVESCIAR